MLEGAQRDLQNAQTYWSSSLLVVGWKRKGGYGQETQGAVLTRSRQRSQCSNAVEAAAFEKGPGVFTARDPDTESLWGGD